MTGEGSRHDAHQPDWISFVNRVTREQIPRYDNAHLLDWYAFMNHPCRSCGAEPGVVCQHVLPSYRPRPKR